MEQKEAHFKYILRLADSSLILGHRISEWCGHGPKLETDIALINVSLDLIGQARFLLDHAAKIEGVGRTQDDLAYKRIEREFLNPIICEQENGDFGRTIIRQLFVDSFNYLLYKALLDSADEGLQAFAEKSLKEVTYHLRHSSQWTIRLGDGTDESKQRVQQAVDELWMFTGGMFEMDEVDQIMITNGIGVDLNHIKELWGVKIKEVLDEATLTVPVSTWMQKGGKQGIHSESLGYILAEMQSIPRTYPDAVW